MKAALRCAASAAVGMAVAGIMALAAPATAQTTPGTTTPPEMVATYNALADAILAVKRTEGDLVRSILAATNAHAEVQFARAQRSIAAGDAAASKAAVEALASDVAQLATEGDAAVAAVRKRLLEGGHHHNSAGEAQGIYDDGFVVVTRAAKQKLLEASRTIGRMAAAPKADALGVEWQKVQATYAGLMKPAK
jgi:hypothetical protein